MATVKYRGESPYVNRGNRKHHPSDILYQDYVDAVEGNVGSGRKVTFALFGFGRAGTIHTRNLVAKSNVALKYIIEVDSSKYELIRRLCGDITEIRPYDQAGEVWCDEEVDAVIITTQTGLHREIILRSLKAGKAVFCEKPIGESPAETEECYSLARELNLPLFCGFQRRWDPALSQMQRKVREGDIGHVQVIRSVSRDNPLPPLPYLKISGGIFHDCMVHDIDIVTWILGELPSQVYTVANAQIPEIADLGDFDNVVSTLTFPSGTIGVINVNRFAVYGYDNRVEAFGMKGLLESENVRPDTVVRESGCSSSKNPILYSFPSRYHDAYNAEMSCFIDVVSGKQELPLTFLHTKSVSRIAEACEVSARTCEPVTMTWEKNEVPKGYTA